MKRRDFIQHLEAHSCELLREGGAHSVYVNRKTRKASSVPRHRAIIMKKTKSSPKLDPDRDTMRPEYDFSKGVRGVTAARYAQGTNLVLIDPELHQLFPTTEAVNDALRSLASIAKRAGRSKSKKRTA